MSLKDIPMLLPKLVEADLVEWAVKTVTSIPASPRKSFTYLAIVAFPTGEKGVVYLTMRGLGGVVGFVGLDALLGAKHAL